MHRATRSCRVPALRPRKPRSPRRPRGARRPRPGFTLIEMLMVVTIIGIMAAIMVPRLRMSPRQRVRAAAVQLQQDLDLARTRALTTRRSARVVFDLANGRYDGYLANRGSTTFAQSAAEQDSLASLRGRLLPDGVGFGRAGVPDVPGFAGAGAVTLPSQRADFNTRGLVEPFGTRGVVYLIDGADPTAVAAVSVTAGAAIRVHTYDGENWR